MACIVCGQDASHRAVLDLVAERRVGGLCRECERTEFGRSLERGRFRETEGCILCARDGHYALPIGRPTAAPRTDGAVEGGVEYDVDDVTVRLCDEHLHALSETTPEATDGRLRREFW